MSLMCCPLCGKYVSRSRYDPSEFDLDVYVADVIGLGRGRGFKRGTRRSILGESEELTPMKDRLLDLVGLFLENGIISGEEFNERFRPESPEVNESEDQSEDESEDESERWRAYAKGLNTRIREMIEKVEDTLDLDLSDEGETAIAQLEAGLDLLVDDYNAFQASVEVDELNG